MLGYKPSFSDVSIILLFKLNNVSVDTALVANEAAVRQFMRSNCTGRPGRPSPSRVACSTLEYSPHTSHLAVYVCPTHKSIVKSPSHPCAETASPRIQHSHPRHRATNAKLVIRHVVWRVYFVTYVLLLSDVHIESAYDIVRYYGRLGSLASALLSADVNIGMR
jgi:hypothetical protein